MTSIMTCVFPTCFGNRDDNDNDDNNTSQASSWALTRIFWTPQLTAEQQMRVWRTDLRKQQRLLDRTLREITSMEVGIKNDIKKATDNKKPEEAQLHELSLTEHQRAKSRVLESKVRLGQLDMELRRQAAEVRRSKAFSASSEVLSMLGGMLKYSELKETALEMSKAMLKAGLIDDEIDATLDGADDDDKNVKAAVDAHMESVIAEIYSAVKSAPVVDEPIDLDDEEGVATTQAQSLTERMTALRPAAGKMDSKS